MKKCFYFFIASIFVVLSSLIYPQDPTQGIIDVNNITSWISNDGGHPPIYLSEGETYNGSFPKGTAGFVYTEGIVWGGKVYDGSSSIIRVCGNTYTYGTSPLTRLYRVRPDYDVADLKDDASNYYGCSIDSVSESMTELLHNQYKKDWNEWPADKGAPFYDYNSDGIYDPEIDIPGVPGASQTIWISYDDSKSTWIYGAPPIGVKVFETYWTYPDSNLSNTIYRNVKLIYSGLNASAQNSHIDSMYFCLFSDPDVGSAGDDYTGCDTALNLGYAYNSQNIEEQYLAYNLSPPAVGYSYLHGAAKRTGNPADSAIVNFAWQHGYKYFNDKPMTVFIPKRTADGNSDPGFNYTGTFQFYNIMRGYNSYPPYPDARLFETNVWGEYIGGYGTYLLAGDPVTGTGWIDGQTEGPGARRMFLMTGPFNIELGDTVETTLALVGGIGYNNIASITNLKYFTRYSIIGYNSYINSYTIGSFKFEKPDTTSHNIIPENFQLTQNYPNPFNPETTIDYSVPQTSHVTIKIYDMLGRLVATLVDSDKAIGNYSIKWKPAGAAGIYIFTMKAGNYIKARKMAYVK
ncbi:MAG TPA: T9SS type A sorting domain-containing protein [Ignavibacteriaceae bacterium]|nr:T9SS type A sorting domain-containing protein [Ignavibacteriaceae bacterium]